LGIREEIEESKEERKKGRKEERKKGNKESVPTYT